MSWKVVAPLLLLLARIAAAQSSSGVLRVTITDQTGLPVDASLTVTAESARLHRTAQAVAGKFTFEHLPLGVYRVAVEQPGFAPYSTLVEVHSGIPRELAVHLVIGAASTQVNVTDAQTLIAPHEVGVPADIGRSQIEEQSSAIPNRGVLDLVDMQPGWIFEANGVLHPRGSEYQTQFVVDGVPMEENRSPGFASGLDTNDVSEMTVLTGTYPAEYGRKLGGVVEVNTQRDLERGWHGSAELGGGSFDTEEGSVIGTYGWRDSALTLAASGDHTSRYLDPPVLGNYSNDGSSERFSAAFDQNLDPSNRIHASVRRDDSRFEVPNENLQQAAGQRQDRSTPETTGQVGWDHVFNANALLTVRSYVEDLSANLWSNPLATPVIAEQQRGFRRSYANVSLAVHRGINDFKFGGDGFYSPVTEALGYQITDPTFFDPGTPPDFNFHDHRLDREEAAYAQDTLRLGNLTLSGGLRFDHYAFLVKDHAWSPRIGASYYVPKLQLVVHASYDRVFQTPATENLLLASSPQVDSLDAEVLRLPVQPSRGNFFEAGFSQAIISKFRLDATVYRRTFVNYADDDVFLNTGISFPIAFRGAQIHGVDVKVDLPHWDRFSGFVSYSNMHGIAQTPVTGGLFLGSDVTSATAPGTSFPITQDQRNSARARLRYQLTPRLWAAGVAQYGSGLPVEADDPDISALQSQYGTPVIDRVNFNAGRVRPNFSLDFSLGATLYKRERSIISGEFTVENVTNQLNVINFAGLFSGTAIAEPRAASARLHYQF